MLTCDVDPAALEQLGLAEHVLLVLPVGETHDAGLDTIHGARLNPPNLRGFSLNDARLRHGWDEM